MMRRRLKGELLGSGLGKHWISAPCARLQQRRRCPEERLPFLVGGEPVGWVSVRIASAMEGMPGIQCERRPRRRWPIRRRCRGSPGIYPARGLYRWRDEAFDVRARPEGPALARIDRGAMPSFRHPGGGGSRQRAGAPSGRRASVDRPAGHGQAAGPGQAGPYCRRRRSGRAYAGGNAGEGGRRGSGDPARAGVRGRSRRDHLLCDGAAGGAAARLGALLRPDTAAGFHRRGRPMARSRRSNSGHSRVCSRRCATPTTSSSM